MTDEELLDRLRADLDAFVGAPGPAPVIAPPAAGRRPLWISLAAAAAVIALVAGGLLVLTRDRSDNMQPLGPAIADVRKPIPRTPAGWTVVEWGDLRLSVPPEMDPFADPSACTTALAPGVLDCSSLGFTVQFSVDPGFVENDGSVVNGVEQVRLGAGEGVFVRDLAMDVFFDGITPATASAIADTIGVSSRWRVEQGEPTPPVPPEWQTVTYEGVSVRVPADWRVGDWTDPDPRFCLQADDVVRPGVLLGRGPVGDATDNCTGPVSLMPPTSGVRIYEVDQPVELPATLPIGERVVTGDGGQQVLVRVGLGIDEGTDSRIARTILDSVTGAPPTPTPPVSEAPVLTPGLPVPPTPDGWSVVEWGDVRFSLPPTIDPYGDGCDARDEQGILVLTCGEQVVTIIPGAGAGQPDPPGTVDLNGLTALRTENRCPEGCSPDFRESTEFLLINLGTVVRFTGFDPADVDELALTIGVSSRWRTTNEPAPPVPADWRSVGFDDIDIRIPDDWPSVTLAPTDADPDACGFKGFEPIALFERGGATVSCVDDPPVLVAPTDGVRIYELRDGETATNAPGFPYIEQEFEVVGEGRRYAVRVGFGIDGTLGRTIFGSIVDVESPPTGVAATAPVTTLTPPASPPPRMAAIATVVQVPGGEPQLCREVLPGTPATCAIGVTLDGWTWDLLDDETVRADDTRIASDVFVEGEFVDEANLLVVSTARRATTLDNNRSALAGVRETDLSIPCEEPAGGWDSVASSGTAAFPVDVVTALPGYAGHWLDPTGRVFVVKTAGDLAAAEVSVRASYQGPFCVAPATRSLAELSAIEIELRSFSSVRFGLTQRIVDARGERVVAESLTPQPELQASLDQRYGEGTVVLTSILQPIG